MSRKLLLQSDERVLESPPMLTRAHILDALEPTDGVLLIRMGTDHALQVELLQGGVLTESRLEQALPFIYQQVLVQRMRIARGLTALPSGQELQNVLEAS